MHRFFSRTKVIAWLSFVGILLTIYFAWPKDDAFLNLLFPSSPPTIQNGMTKSQVYELLGERTSCCHGRGMPGPGYNIERDGPIGDHHWWTLDKGRIELEVEFKNDIVIDHKYTYKNYF